MQVAGTFQSKPTVGQNFPSIASESLAGNWVLRNTDVASSLGRSLSGNAAVATVNIVKPGTVYYPRLNQFDVRVAKIVRLEQKRLNVSVDVYNVFNSSAADQFQQTYGASWLN